MDRDTVIALAKQAKVFFDDRKINYCFYPNQLLEFAKLVASHEREECAKVAEDYTDKGGGQFIDYEGHGYSIAAAIRSRE